MIIELKLEFKDEFFDGEEEPLTIIHTLNAPAGFEITGGQLFVENPNNSDLERFSFRIDRDDIGAASLTILEDVNT